MSQNVDHPLSLYGASKKANELMAHAYAHLFALPTTGLRFFTVYGPWGRPDMAMWLFADAILAGRPIKLFNRGDMKRDFTYVDDVATSVVKLIDHPPQGNAAWSGDDPDPATSRAPWRVYNIGNHTPVELMEVVRLLEAGARQDRRSRSCCRCSRATCGRPAPMSTPCRRRWDLRRTRRSRRASSRFVDWFRGYHRV